MNEVFEEPLLTKEEIRQRLQLKSTHKVDTMVKAGLLPVICMGSKTLRFYWPDVEKALKKMVLNAVV
jgi:hypothetical protein